MQRPCRQSEFRDISVKWQLSFHKLPPMPVREAEQSMLNLLPLLKITIYFIHKIFIRDLYDPHILILHVFLNKEKCLHILVDEVC